MANALSNDLRIRIITDFDDGNTYRATAERFDVAPSTVVKLVAHSRKTGTHEPKPKGGDKRSGRIEKHADTILGIVDGQPDITLAELAEHLELKHDEVFGTSTIWRFFHRRGITFKKNRTCQRAGTPGRRAGT